MNINKLKVAIYNSCAKDTCFPNVADEWNENNPLFWHCTIVALIVNDYYGGTIRKSYINGISHYYNYIDNKIIDLTREQFLNEKVSYDDYIVMDRDEIISNKNTPNRYFLLKDRVSKYIEKLDIIDNEIFNCKKCIDMVEKFPNSNTIHYGSNNDIVILGEAPANNGWRKSGIAWYDINNKLLASGVVLQKLLDITNVKLEETTFIEAIKCYPKDRKYLKQCGNNCRDFLFKQLNVLKPRVVLVLGDYATKTVLNEDYKSFKDVVGKYYKINNMLIVPIYHPSPISPLSYKGNVPIFEKIKRLLEGENI